MLVSLLVTIVSGFDDGVEEIGENFVGFFITSDGTDSHDEGVAGIVDTGLEDGLKSLKVDMILILNIKKKCFSIPG